MIKLDAGGAVSNNIPDHFSEIPLPHEVPCRLTALKTLPSVTPAAVSHPSTTALTQTGIGAVRM